MPEPDYELEFKNWKYCTRAPFVIYADLESVLLPINKRSGQSTHLYHHHKPCAAAALLISTVQNLDNQFFIHVGEDSVQRLLEKLIEWERVCIEHLEQNIPMRPLTRQQQERHDTADTCCICHNERRPFDPNDGNYRKVRDHDHITGYYIGAAHDLCNRKRRVVFDIPVFFHNMRCYDGHLIVQSFNQFPNREIKVLGQNIERYIQVKWGDNMVFRDSLMHLSSSLKSLAESLKKKDPTRFTRLQMLISRQYPACDPNLLLRKGVFPYEYLDLIQKLQENSLPTRESFYSSLSGQECSEDDYRYAQQVLLFV